MALFRPAPSQPEKKKAPAASGATPWYRRRLVGTSAQDTTRSTTRTTSGSATGTRGSKTTKNSKSTRAGAAAAKGGAKAGTGARTRAGAKARTGARAGGASKAKAAPATAPRRWAALLKGGGAAGGTAGRSAAKTAPRTRATPRGQDAQDPPPPVLQRRSLGSVLARAAVMAIALVCMVGFAVALAKVTLVPSPASDSLVHTNLKPGASIRAYLDQPAIRDSIKQIGGNVLLGVPFGVLLPMLFPRARGLLRVAVVTALVMVMVETAQGMIVEGRAFDIDDVILNTTGALLGYLLLGRRLGRALHPRREHWWHRYGFTRDRPPARTRP